MSSTVTEPVYYDPYKVEIWNDPYPVYQRMREEVPLYYNEEYDFYAATRYDDVKAGLMDPKTFSSARGDILEIIKMDFEVPKGIFIFEDPPTHTAHRNVLAILFTPKNVNPLKDKIRELCARALDPVMEGEKFDFVKDLGTKMPMAVIGLLLGIPDQDLEDVRTAADKRISTGERGKPMDYKPSDSGGEDFAGYIDWRIKNPSDDIMTQLLNTEFKDETGTVRKLEREELLGMITMLATAGNETTNRLIGWSGKVLAEHPDQRREIARDLSLVPAAIEEILRFECPGPHAARYVTRDVEIQGQVVPKGSAIDFILSAANRDERRFENGDSFNIHRPKVPHLTFGNGIHHCIGSVLARMEGQIALEEVMKRFTDWEVDYDNAVLSSTTAVRGWDTLPTFLR